MHAFKNSDNVIMMFSLTESSSFQGIARMEGEPDPNYKPEFFQKNKSEINNLNYYNNSHLNFQPNFKITWLLKCQYPFRDLDHLPGNPLNDNEPVFKGFNGQEIPARIGNYLSHLMLKDGMDNFSETKKPKEKVTDKELGTKK